MVLTEVVRETTLSSLFFQVPKYTHPTRVGYQDLHVVQFSCNILCRPYSLETVHLALIQGMLFHCHNITRFVQLIAVSGVEVIIYQLIVNDIATSNLLTRTHHMFLSSVLSSQTARNFLCAQHIHSWSLCPHTSTLNHVSRT